MRKKKDTHSFDFRPLGLAIREAREQAGLSRNDLVTMFHISVDEYFYPQENAEKSTIRRQIDVLLDDLTDDELKIIQGTIDGIMKYKGTGSK